MNPTFYDVQFYLFCFLFSCSTYIIFKILWSLVFCLHFQEHWYIFHPAESGKVCLPSEWVNSHCYYPQLIFLTHLRNKCDHTLTLLELDLYVLQLLLHILLYCSDELFQLEAEAHSSCSWHQQEWTGLIQTSQNQRVVVASSSPTGGRMAGVQLPRCSQLWHPDPSSAWAMEPCGLCRILNMQKSCCQCSWLSSGFTF